MSLKTKSVTGNEIFHTDVRKNMQIAQVLGGVSTDWFIAYLMTMFQLQRLGLYTIEGDAKEDMNYK
jgi:hypothetical protein